MNAYDSERMAEALADQGYALTADAAEADLVILNTCHIREKAAEKVYSELGRVRLNKERRRREGRDTLIAVAGCVAQAEGAEIMARAPAVDIVVGPQSYHRLAASRRRGLGHRQRPGRDGVPGRGQVRPSAGAAATKGARRQPSSPCRKAATNSAPSASCPIPAAPNSLATLRRSSPRWSGLRHAGAREITLLGQNVNAYHGARSRRPRLDACQTVAAARANPRDRPAALHHQPPARHGR